MKRTDSRSCQSGFSLVELMISVAIIAVLATIGTRAYDQMIDRAHLARMKNTVRLAQVQLESFHTETPIDEYPMALTSAENAFAPKMYGCLLNDVTGPNYPACAESPPPIWTTRIGFSLPPDALRQISVGHMAVGAYYMITSFSHRIYRKRLSQGPIVGISAEVLFQGYFANPSTYCNGKTTYGVSRVFVAPHSYLPASHPRGTWFEVPWCQ